VLDRCKHINRIGDISLMRNIVVFWPVSTGIWKWMEKGIFLGIETGLDSAVDSNNLIIH
jgi:hypothetical protein